MQRSLYSFTRTSGGMLQRVDVFVPDDSMPQYISYNINPAGGTGSGNRPPDGTTVGSFCQPGTYNRYVYKSQTNEPFANFELFPNSAICGYSPSPCDIQEKTFEVTDETAAGANNGTINLFVVTSYAPVTYYLNNTDNSVQLNNTTGYFTNLAPGNYHIKAIDANQCTVDEDATVKPFDNTLTHYKYKMGFTSISPYETEYEVRFFDRRNNYDSTQYPKELVAGDTPLKITRDNKDEAKESAVVSTEVNIQLHYDAVSFDADEFKFRQEKDWYIEVWRNGQIDFKGYLLPDEIQDYYEDPPYNLELTATEGLPSLKGNKWGDGSGGKGYGTAQVPQFGLARYLNLIKQCLDQLGYDYGETTLATSLQYNLNYNPQLYDFLGTWSDVLYGSDGVPNDTYNCLELLLKGLGLTIVQHKGEFYLVNWSTLSYINNSAVITDYNQSFYRYNASLTTTSTTPATKPVLQPVGFGYALKPVNPVQTVNLDKPYNIKLSVDFNLLALLYPNPSFEIGAVEGQLPNGFYIDGTITAALHNDQSAYDGQWELRVSGVALLKTTVGPVTQKSLFFIADNQRLVRPYAFIVDQANKAIKVSFKWRPVYYSDTENVVPALLFNFVDDADGTSYYYSPLDQEWIIPLYDYAFAWESNIIADYVAWNDYSVTTIALPGSGKGQFLFGFKPPFRVRNDNVLIPNQGPTPHTIDYDSMEITIVDASEGYSKQTGENHNITAIVTQAETKQLDVDLFTYPQNKRVAGNIFTTNNYATGEVANKWNYRLKAYEQADRLPAVLAKAIGRYYQRPMVKWEGDVEALSVDFYGMFSVRGYEGRVFMPYRVAYNCLKNVATITIIEVDDSDQQAEYQYVPVFEKSARKNTN